MKVKISERLDGYSNYFSPANVIAEPYIMLREKCKKEGLRITRVVGALCDMYVKGDITFYD